MRKLIGFLMTVFLITLMITKVSATNTHSLRLTTVKPLVDIPTHDVAYVVNDTKEYVAGDLQCEAVGDILGTISQKRVSWGVSNDRTTLKTILNYL